MTARERFTAALDSGKEISSLAFSGDLHDFTQSDRRWLRTAIKRGEIWERVHPIWPHHKLYCRPLA